MIAIKFVLLLANFLGWFSFLNRIFNKSAISISMFPAIWISFGFICNLFDLLKYGFYLFVILGYAFLLWQTFICIKQKTINSLFTSQISLLFIILGLLFIRMAPSYFSYPDEFTFWGLVVKELTFFDQLTPTEYAKHPVLAYLNGPAIGIYYFTKFFGYSEGIAIFGASTLFTLFSSFLIYNQKRILSSIILYISILCLSVFYNPGFGSIYADYMVAINFGVILVVFYKYHQKNHTKLLLLSIPLIISISVLKQISLTLCVLMAISIIAMMVKQKKYNIKLIFLVFLLFSIPQLLDYAWHEKNISLYNTLFKDYGFIDKILLISSQEPNFVYKVTSNFILQISLFFFTKSGSLIFLFILITTVLLQKKYQTQKNANTKHLLFFSIIIFSGFCIHRLILYLSVFDPAEALIASSLKRYMNTIVISFAGVLLYMNKLVFIKMPDKEYNKLRNYFKTYLIIFSLLLFSRLHRKPRIFLNKNRVESRKEAQQLMPLLREGKNIYFNFSDYSDAKCSDTRLELTPYARQTNINECHKYSLNNDLQKQEIVSRKYDFIYFPKDNLIIENKKGLTKK